MPTPPAEAGPRPGFCLRKPVMRTKRVANCLVRLSDEYSVIRTSWDMSRPLLSGYCCDGLGVGIGDVLGRTARAEEEASAQPCKV